MDQPTSTYRNASSRSWLEMNVRPAIVLFLLMTIIVLGMGIFQFTSGMKERRIIATGTPVKAKVTQIGLKKDRIVPRDDVTYVVLEYVDPKSGMTFTQDGNLPRKPKSSVSLDEILTIRIDPNDPASWTERSEPVSLLLELSVPLILSPLVPLTLWLAWRQRNRVLKVLATGQIKKASVSSIKHSSIAPMSSIISFAVDGTDRTIRSAYWPKSSGPIKLQDRIDVIDNGTGLPIPARSYQA